MIDNGIGIPKDESSLLFKPYSTLRNAREINATGAGLGLFICKKLAMELKGGIKALTDLDPKLGGKTAFVVDISAEVAVEETEINVGDIRIDAYVPLSKILIFED